MRYVSGFIPHMKTVSNVNIKRFAATLLLEHVYATRTMRDLLIKQKKNPQFLKLAIESSQWSDIVVGK